jgi:hypothetical protein
MSVYNIPLIVFSIWDFNKLLQNVYGKCSMSIYHASPKKSSENSLVNRVTGGYHTYKASVTRQKKVNKQERASSESISENETGHQDSKCLVSRLWSGQKRGGPSWKYAETHSTSLHPFTQRKRNPQPILDLKLTATTPMRLPSHYTQGQKDVTFFSRSRTQLS